MRICTDYTGGSIYNTEGVLKRLLAQPVLYRHEHKKDYRRSSITNECVSSITILI